MGSPVPTSDLRSRLIFKIIAISWVLPKPGNSDSSPVAAGMLDEDFMAAAMQEEQQTLPVAVPRPPQVRWSLVNRRL